MKYFAVAHSLAKQDAVIHIKEANVQFGITPQHEETLSNPAELLLGAFAACILKSVERFSGFMNFTYTSAEVKVRGTRLEKPPRMSHVDYTLTLLTSDEEINTDLLQRNIEHFGTIFNTVKVACEVKGEVVIGSEM